MPPKPFPKVDTVTVWTLNRATALVGSADLQAAFGPDVTNRFLGYAWGKREDTHNHELMFEGSDADTTEEYFVPIALKCLGNRFQEKLTGNAGKLLAGIRAQYPFFADEAAFTKYWGVQSAPLGTMRMHTLDGVGYYDLLPEKGNNVLIGYSQGGLVARYLAFLDEYVFQENRIAGVITVQAPNHGSPVANSSHGEATTDGLLDVVLSLFSLYPDVFKLLAGYLKRLDFAHVYGLIESLFQDLLSRVNSLSKEEKGLLETARSAMKWMSGMRPFPIRTAFNDLGTETYAEPFSVLSLVHQYPLQRIVSGAVVGCNASLDPLAFALLGLFYPVATLPKPLGRDMAGNLGMASDVYARTVMRDPLVAPAGVADWPEENLYAISLMLSYANGYSLGTDRIPKFAHDFVIPSVSQVLDHDQRSAGHVLNLDANHLSGSSRASNNPAWPGEKNADAIVTLLGNMKRRLVDRK